MTDLSFSIPDDLAQSMQSRLSEGRYADAGEYLTDLVRRDLAEAADAAWVRAEVTKGLASGIIDKNPSEVIKEIIAERRARRG